jgi:hypothetical protein
MMELTAVKVTNPAAIRLVFQTAQIRHACGKLVHVNEAACLEGKASLYRVGNRGFVQLSKNAGGVLWINAAAGFHIFSRPGIGLLRSLLRLEGCDQALCEVADPRKRAALRRLGWKPLIADKPGVMCYGF